MGGTCAISAVPAVGVDAGADVGAVRVLAAGVLVAVRAKRALIHICGERTNKTRERKTTPGAAWEYAHRQGPDVQH